MTTELARIDGSVRELVAAGDLNLATLTRRVTLIADIKREILIENEHYGTIPGCGPRPTLFQPGAQQFASLFGLVPRIDAEVTTCGPGDHRTIETKIRMVHPGTGVELADGIGTCSTLESRYRYRKMERICPSCGEAKIIKGKSQYGGGWVCWKTKGGCGAKFDDGDAAVEGQETGKVEYEDPADYWNTVRKIAYKRAMFHAVLNSIGGSGSFTQDVEDSPEVFGGRNKGAADAPALRQPQAKTAPAQGQPDPGYISEPQRKRLFAITKECGVNLDDLRSYLHHNHGDESTAKIRKQDYEDVVNWVQAQGKANASV